MSLLHFLALQQWAMHSPTLDQMVAILERHASGDKMDQDAVTAAIGRDPDAADAREPTFEIRGDTAIVPMRGVMARYADQVNGICQARGRSAESVQSDLIRAAEAGVNRIIMRMDSPGGSVSGTFETADLVRQLSARGVQMVAFVDGLAASGCYAVASQADEIIASAPTASVGSIGVATVLIERLADDKRERAHVITSAPAKASPVLNEAHIANARALVADIAETFASYVAGGRGLTEEQTAKVATGEVWTAKQGMALGLVDRIASFEEVLAESRPSTARRIIVTHIPPAASAAIPAASATTTPAADPAASPGDPMKITAQVLAALVAAFPHHAATISAKATAGEDEGAIRNDLAKLDREATEARAAAMTKSLDDEKSAHKATADKLAALEKEHAELKALAKAGSGDPGEGSPEGSNIKTRAQFDALPQEDRTAFISKGGRVVA